MKRIYLGLDRFLLSVLFIAFCTLGSAQTNTSTGAVWNVNGNWSLGHIPLAAEDVVINSALMTMNQNVTVNSITVNTGKVLTIGNSVTALAISTGNVTTLGTGTINVGAFATTHTFSISGTLSNAGTFNMYNAAGKVCNVTMNGPTITGIGAYTFNTLTIGAAVTVSATSVLSIDGDLTCNAALTSSGTINFTGGIAQNLNGTTNPTFNLLGISTNLTHVTLSGISGITVNGTLTMANTSIFDFGAGSARTVTVVGNLVTPQTITMTGAGLAHSLKLGGAANGPIATAFTTTAASGSTVEYNAAGAQSIFASPNYINLLISGTGTKTIAGASTVSSNLTITAAGVLVSNATALGVTGNLTASGTGTTTWGGAANTTTITGNVLVTNNTTFNFGDQAAVKTMAVTGNVQVDAGSTIGVGAFAAVHALTISGNLQADGTFNMVQTFPGNVCNVTFSGAANTTLTGVGATCAFNQITLNKPALANTLDVQRVITMSAPTAAGTYLTLTGGTFKLSSASTLTPYYGAATICAGIAGLWLNNAGANVSCVQTNTSANPGIPTITGTLHLSAGTFAYGSGNDGMLLNAATSSLTIDGGTLNMYGGVAFSSTSLFSMTSGAFNIYPQGFDNLAIGTPALSFASTNASAVTFTGGTLTLVDPHSATGGTALILPAAGGYNFTGSTIRFGDGVSNKSGAAPDGFSVNGGSTYSLGTVILNNGASAGTNRQVRLITTNTIIGDALTIGSNVQDNLMLNGRTLTLNGTLTVGAGTLNATAASNLSIGGNNTPVMNLPPIAGGATLNNLTINKTGTNSTVNLGGPVTLAGTLTMTAGVLEIGNYNLTLPSTTIGGTPFSAANMIATDGTGYLIRNANSAQTLSPIGAGTYYSPMTLTSIASNLGTYSIRAVPSALNAGYILVYWDFITSLGGKTITATFQYDPAQANGAGSTICYLPVPPGSTIQSPPASGASSFGANTFTITGNTPFTSGYWTMGTNATYYSYQTGDWNTPTTWTSDPSGTVQTGSTIPGFNDNVVILTGRTVSLSSNITTKCMNLTINSAGFVDMSTFNFTNGLTTLSGQGTLRLATVNFPTIATNTLVNSGGGTVEYYNGASFTLPVTQSTYNNLTINSAGFVATQLANLTLNGNLLVKSGTFQINDNVTTATLSLIISGNVTVNSGAAIAVGNGLSNTTAIGGASSSGGVAPFTNYYVSNFHKVVVNGNFTNNGTVRFTNLTYPVFNAFPPIVAGPTSGAASVYFQGSTNNVLTCNGITDFYNLVVDKGVDQTYSLTVISSNFTYFRLFGANSLAGETAGANPTLRKALWIRTGTLDLQGLTVIPSLTEGNTAGPPTSDYYIPANGALVIDGPDVTVLSTADDYREVNASYGIAGGSNLIYGVITGGYSSLYVFGTFKINDGYLSTRESGGVITSNVASGQIIVNGGNIDAKQILFATGSASYTQTGGNLTIRGRFQRTPSSYASVYTIIDTTASTLNPARVLNGITTGYGSFSLNNTTNIFNMSNGSIQIYDVCDLAGQFAMDVKSSVSNTTVTGGQIQMIPTTGTGLADPVNMYISSTASFGNLLINRASGTSVVQLNTGYPLTVLSSMNIQSGDFNANAQNLTIGGNFNIALGTTYTTGANTTILNGSGTQTFTVGLAAALSLNNLTITKAAGQAVNFAGSQKTINIAGALSLTLGTLFDNGNSIYVAGNVFNSGLHTGTVLGKISLNGAATTQTIDGNGIFNNLELNNTNAAAAPISLVANTTINGTLTFSQAKLFNISTYNLLMNASATFVSAGPTKYIQCAGNAGDGGITKVFSSPAAFVFPLGAGSTSHVGVPNYTPASIGFSAAPTAYGSVNVVPVGYAHPNETTAGRSLSYFWRVKSTGFTLGAATVTHGYTYSVNDVITGVGITENGYVAARYNLGTATWTEGTTSDLDIVGKIIGQPTPGTFLKNVAFIDGDYTAGDNTPTDPFGTPKTFYSYQSGPWGTNTSWTSDPTRATQVLIGTPGAVDIVNIGAGHTISFGTPANYLINPNTDPHSCATLYIQTGSTLDIRYNPASNFGIVMTSAGGNGKIRIACAQASGSTFANPSGDFTSFNTNLGTTELYSTSAAAGTTYWFQNGVTTYGNLLISPLGGSNIIFPNNSVTIYGTCTTNGQNADSWFLPTWTGAYPNAPTATIAKTITINGDLNIQGGAFGFYGNGANTQTIVVKGNVIVAPAAGLMDFGGGANSETFNIGGNLINNSDGAHAGVGTTSICDFVSNSAIPVTFSGTTNASISNTAGNPTTSFSQVFVNKGSSQATTLTLDIAGVLNTPADNWLNLQNGTFKYQRTNPATDLTISTVTNLNVPSTAGLYINYPNSGNKNVLISNSGADASDMLLSGALTVISGNVYVGPVAAPAFNNDIEYSGLTASITVQGGSLFVNGQIRRPTATTNGVLNYTQSAGSVTINGNTSAGGAAVAVTRAKLEIVNSGSQFNLSGASTITIARGAGTTFGDLYLRPGSATVTGGTITFTNVVPNSLQNYLMDANVPLFNLTVTGAAGAGVNANVGLMSSPLVLNGALTLTNARSILISNNVNLTINGNLNNSGTYTYGTNLTTFSGATQLFTGTSVTNFYDLTVSPSVSLTVNNSFNVNRNLTIGNGTLILNPAAVYKVSVLNGGSFVNNGAYTDDNSSGSGVSLAGNSQQQVSGTGSFDRLELNNTAGALLLNSISLQNDLVLTQGILNIQSFQLTLGTGSNIGGSPFSATKMIKSDGVATSLGVQKFFPIIAVATPFTYPVGVTGKYTPALFTINASASIGYINVNPVNTYQPTVLDPTNVLQYYWSITSSGISGFNGSSALSYVASDVRGLESTYLAAWLQLPGTYWSKVPGNDNAVTHVTNYTYPAGTTNLNGDYTAGLDAAIPNQIPTYISNANGTWTNPAIWTPVGSSPACPPSGPNGYNVIIQNNVTISSNNAAAYTTVIYATGDLIVASPTFGHNLGIVSGDATFGAGTLTLQSGNLPAGTFTDFLSCAAGGTLEYGGSGAYTMVLSGITTLPNLKVSGTGSRILPNSDLVICNNLIINGATLDNSVSNRKLTVQGSMQRLAGSFVSGSGVNATVTLAGSVAQTIGGALGDFSGANGFNNFEINNSAGLTIGAGGTIEVNGNLLLTSGIITTSATSKLSVLNTSNAAVIPNGGSSSSYISGPFTKQILNGNSFFYPIGKASYGHYFTLTSTTTGSSPFTAEYFTPNPTSASYTAPLVLMNSMEYWGVTSTGAKTAKVQMAWDAQSDLNGTMTIGGMADLQASLYNTGTSSWTDLVSTTAGSNSVGTVATTGNVNISTTTTNYCIGSLENTKPAASLSPAGPICGTAGIPVTFNAKVAITLNYTISYNFNGAAQTPIVVSSLPFTLPTPSPGAYQLTGFSYNNSSIAGVVDGTIVNTSAAPSTSVAGPNQSPCGVTNTTLAANNPVVGTGAWTIVSGTGGTLLANTAYNSGFLGLLGKSYVLKWTTTNGACTSSSTVNIAFPYVPAQPTGFTAAPSPVCQGSTGNIYTVPTVATATSYAWSYSGTGATITGTGNSVSVDFNATATSGTMSAAAVNGCGTGAARTIAITVQPLAVATFNYTSSPYCQNGANPTPVGTAGTFSSTAGLVFVSTATGQVNVAASTPGTYTVTNTIPASGPCGIVTATNTITITAYGTWVGLTNSDWFTASNWVCGTIPTSTVDVIIPAGAPSMPAINAAGAVCRSIQINAGGSLTLNGANNLNVYGNWIDNNTVTVSNTSTVTFNGVGTISGSAVTTFNNVIIAGTGNITAPAGNMNITGNWTNNGAFNASTGTVTFVSAATQTIGGTASTTFNNLTINNSSATGINLGIAASMNGVLTLTQGLINTTATKILTLNNTASTTIGNATSFVNGPLACNMSNLGTSTLNLPIGKGLDWRPAVLSPTQSTGISYTYTAELFDSSALALGWALPITIDNVSTVHFMDINRTVTLTTAPASSTDLTSAVVRMYYNTGAVNGNGDSVNDYVNLTIAKAPVAGSTWTDISGTATANGTGSILSGAFTSFSRFVLANKHLGNNALPIELLSFTAKENKNVVDLNWVTASEINNDYFSIERTRNGTDFELIGTQKGAGNSTEKITYSMIDNKPLMGISYYRLSQTDFNGLTHSFNPVAVDFNPPFNFSVYPNPSNGDNLFLSLSGDISNKEILVVLYNETGQLTYSKVILTGQSNNLLEAIDPANKLPAGVYLIVASSDNAIYKQKIIIQ